MDSYREVLDQRIIDLHKLYSEKFREDPALQEEVIAALAIWKATADAKGSDSTIQEWYDILNLPRPEFLKFITSDSERAILNYEHQTHLLVC